MSFDKIFDLTAGVYFNFYNIFHILVYTTRYKLITGYLAHTGSETSSVVTKNTECRVPVRKMGLSHTQRLFLAHNLTCGKRNSVC